jgi:hypothetical protein
MGGEGRSAGPRSAGPDWDGLHSLGHDAYGNLTIP